MNGNIQRVNFCEGDPVAILEVDGKHFIRPISTFSSASSSEQITHTVKVFNLSRRGHNQTLYVRHFDGMLKKVGKVSDAALNLNGVHQKDNHTRQVFEMLSEEGGILIEVTASGKPDIEFYERHGHIYELVEPEAHRLMEIEYHRFNPDNDSYVFYVWITEDKLDEYPDGMYVPQAGMTIGTRRTLQRPDLAMLSASDATENVTGFRYRLDASRTRYAHLYMVINDNLVSVTSPNSNYNEDGDFLYIYITDRNGEHCVGRVTVEDALSDLGATIEYTRPGNKKSIFKHTVRLFENRLKAEKATREVDELKAALADEKAKVIELEKEATEAEKRHAKSNRVKEQEVKQSLWSRTINFLSNILAPITKLITIVLAIFI